MKTWKELSRVEKIVFGFLLVCAFLLMPEASFLMGVGGVDLGLFVLLMYSQNIKTWVDMHFGMISYPLIETKSYVKSISLSSVLFFITSSFVFSSGFFLLLMFLRNE